MAGTESGSFLTSASPVLTQWKLTQDEENGNTIDVTVLKNGNSSPRPVLKKVESVEIVDCESFSYIILICVT